jgi:predicted permease
MTGRKYADAGKVFETYRDLWSRIGSLPGVAATGGVTSLPLSQMMAWGPITVEGRQSAAGEKFINVDIRTVAGDYFRTMEIPLAHGRFFAETDTKDSPVVVVVDQRMADDLWPGQDPIGKRIRTGGFDVTADTPWMTVVGVAGRVRQYALDGAEPRIAMYFSHRQRPSRALTVVLRTTASDPAALAPAVRQQIRQIDPDLPVYNVRTMDQRVEDSLGRRRFAMTLLTLFAVLALGLSTIGTYGVMAYVVSQGTREIGIRMALGATHLDVARMIVTGGMTIALAGIACGVGAALVLTRFMGTLLFEIAPSDPLTFGVIASLIALTALAATCVPAWSAARIDPLVSLRSE